MNISCKKKRIEFDFYIKKQISNKYDNWINSLNEEIGYWNNYLSTGGGDYREDFEFRLKLDTKIKDRDVLLSNKISEISKKDIVLLDVGSGPLTNLGKIVEGKSLEIIACDPLAGAYKKIINKVGIKPPVETIFADCENLSHFFEKESFDAIHCANALDHSYDPVGGICEMLSILKNDGFIHLGHFENEAEAEKYSGLHQWNFTEKDSKFIIWNKSVELDLSSYLGEIANIRIERIAQVPKDWLVVSITKNTTSDTFLSDRSTTLGIKYQTLVNHHCQNFI